MCYVIQFFATNVRAANIKSVLAFEVAVVAVLGCVVVSNQPVHLYGQFLTLFLCFMGIQSIKALGFHQTVDKGTTDSSPEGG